MISFPTIEAYIAHLETVADTFPGAVHSALTDAGKKVQKHSKTKMGEYQQQAGPFAVWQQLSLVTLAYHEKVGPLYGLDPDSPLLVTGKLKESLLYSVQGYTLYNGSDDPIAEYQEKGTDKIPPRSFIGASLFEMAPKISEDIAEALVRHLETGS